MRRLILALAALALLAGCAGRQAAAPPAPTSPPAPSAPAPSAPAPTGAPATSEPAASAPATQGATPAADSPVDLDAAKAGIQATLDDYARAYATNDLQLLESTVDQSNAPFRRLVEERFTTSQGSVLGADAFRLAVKDVEARGLGFVQAHIERDGWIAYDWLFREVDGRWLLSEPSEEQLGERFTFESEHFTYEAYHWSDDVNQKLAALMERARTQVGERLGTLPEGKYTVRLRPIFGLTPPSPPGAVAWYAAAGRPRGDRMHINAPGGYQFGGYVAADGWEADLYSTLVHEYTHLVNQRSFMPTAEMRDWMYEGLAEYVADSPRAGEVSAAVQSGNIIPIIDPNGGTNPQDLDHLYLLERDRSLAYGLSYSLVAYIDQELGGLEKFWELARAMNETPGTGEARYDGAMQKVFGKSYREFDQGWREWLRQNY
jgi:hypothetical protein